MWRRLPPSASTLRRAVPTAESPARPFLAELAENDGVAVVLLDGRVWGRTRCPHIVSAPRELRTTNDIDAVVKATSYCPVTTCEPRVVARSVLADLEIVGRYRS